MYTPTWDKYDREARVFPALLTLLPFFILEYFFLREHFTQWTSIIRVLESTLVSTASVSLSVVLLFFVMSLIQLISKSGFQKFYFKNSLYLPTTSFLLYSNKEFSLPRKKKIREKIKADFGAKLASEKEEGEDELEARKIIDEAVGYIRNAVKGGRFVLVHNIHYGFWRNLIGGSTIGILLSVVDIVVFYYYDHQPVLLLFSWFLGTCYLIILLLSKIIMNSLAVSYAKRLYEEYLSGTY